MLKLIIAAMLTLAASAAIACDTAELAKLAAAVQLQNGSTLEVAEPPAGLNTTGRPLADLAGHSPQWRALAEYLPDALLIKTDESCHGCTARRIWIIAPNCNAALTGLDSFD